MLNRMFDPQSAHVLGPNAPAGASTSHPARRCAFAPYHIEFRTPGGRAANPLQTLSEIRQLLDRPAAETSPGTELPARQESDPRHSSGLRIQPHDLVLEIGPGTGTLTEAFLEARARVVACEIDEAMAAIIHDRLAHHLATHDTIHRTRSGLLLLRGDALRKQRQLNPEVVHALAEQPFKLVANLPYHLASPLMTTLLIDHPNCTGEWVTIQREVADRLTAVPSSKAYGPLSVVVHGAGEGSQDRGAESIVLLAGTGSRQRDRGDHSRETPCVLFLAAGSAASRGLSRNSSASASSWVRSSAAQGARVAGVRPRRCSPMCAPKRSRSQLVRLWQLAAESAA